MQGALSPKPRKIGYNLSGMTNARWTATRRTAADLRPLLADVPEFDNVTAAVAAARHPGQDAPAGFWKASEVRGVQLVLAKKIAKPSAETTWLSGETAHAAGEEWCSGLLFLFAAGYYERFASVLCTANSASIGDRRKGELVAAMRTACQPTIAMTPDQYRLHLIAIGISEISAMDAVKKFRANGCQEARTDRDVAQLTLQERAALRDAFARDVLGKCRDAERAKDDVLTQRDAAATALWKMFNAGGPGW